jgi:micrococcal nuclease
MAMNPDTTKRMKLIRQIRTLFGFFFSFLSSIFSAMSRPSAFRAVLALIAAVPVLAACSPEPDDHRDPFVRAIFGAYPELRGRAYDIETVKRVVDGDTFVTEGGDRVRLIGVDTPEVHGRTEHYGKEASAFSGKRLTGNKVYMFKDVSETDRYGRLLRYVFVENETRMFNEILIAEGYGTALTVPPDVMFAEKFVRAEREARKNEAGLWAEAESAESDDTAEPAGSAGTAGQADAGPGCAEPMIKGNINSRGEKIYHVPGGRYYEQTKAEEMFCTEEEARAAGYRPVKS